MNRLSRLVTAGVLVLATLVASCSTTIVRTMMPTPIVIQDERLDFSRIVAPDRRVTEEGVFFATTRAPAPPQAPERYTSRKGDAVRLGVARVQLGEPGWSYDDLVASDRTSRPETPRPARVVAVEEFGIFGAPGGAAERELVAAIDRQVERVPAARRARSPAGHGLRRPRARGASGRAVRIGATSTSLQTLAAVRCFSG